MPAKTVLLLFLIIIVNIYAKADNSISAIMHNKPGFLSATSKTNSEQGEIIVNPILNTDKQFWYYDQNLGGFVNNSMTTTLVYNSNSDFKKPLKLKIFSPDIEDGLIIEVHINKQNAQQLLEKKGNFRFTDYFEGEINQPMLSISTEEQDIIENIYACRVELKLNFKVVVKHNIPAGKTIKICYKISKF